MRYNVGGGDRLVTILFSLEEILLTSWEGYWKPRSGHIHISSCAQTGKSTSVKGREKWRSLAIMTRSLDYLVHATPRLASGPAPFS